MTQYTNVELLAWSVYNNIVIDLLTTWAINNISRLIHDHVLKGFTQYPPYNSNNTWRENASIEFRDILVTLCKACDINNKQLKLQLVATLLKHKGAIKVLTCLSDRKKRGFKWTSDARFFWQIYQRTNSKAITLYLKGKVYDIMRFRR